MENMSMKCRRYSLSLLISKDMNQPVPFWVEVLLLEAPLLGASNDYPQCNFHGEIRKKK